MRDRRDKDAATIAIFSTLLLVVGLTVASVVVLWGVTTLFGVPESVSGLAFVAVEVVVLVVAVRFLVHEGQRLRR